MSPKANRKTSSRPLIFISHSAVDAWVAHRIADSIDACGAETFLSEKLEAGADFPEEIRLALNRSKELVAYLTPWALKRPWLLLETGGAWVLRRRVVCLLHGVTPEELTPDTFPLAIATKVFVNINNIEAGYLVHLRRRIGRKHLKKEPPLDEQ